jgi:tetratricopeptide (TPR) repeat protein
MCSTIVVAIGSCYVAAMNEFLIGLLGALLSTNQVVSVSNVVARSTGMVLPVTDPNDPVEQEFQKVLALDDGATTEVDQWIKDNNAQVDRGGAASLTLSARIEQRFEQVRQAYDEFILHHPDHARARLAYGSMLNDHQHEEQAVEQWEKARELDPKNPAPWNNLAEAYSHHGPVTKSFEYLAKAIELRPTEPLYRRNLALVVFLFRKDAQEFYHLADDQAVLRRSLELYREARKLDPSDFVLATDLAQVFYYVKPPATDTATAAAEAEQKLCDEALSAWRDAERAAPGDSERQGVNIHMARVCLSHGRFAEARRQLEAVKDPGLEALKSRVARNLAEQEKSKETAAPVSPAVVR